MTLLSQLFAKRKILAVLALAVLANVLCQAADAISGIQSFHTRTAGVAAAEAAYQHEADTTKREQLWLAFTRTNDATITNVMQIVRTMPGDPAAFEMISWVLANNRNQVGGHRLLAEEAVAILRDHHTTHTNLGAVCQALGWRWNPRNQTVLDFLCTAATNNPARNDRALALFAFAHLTKIKAENLATFEFGPTSIRTNERVKAFYAEDEKAGDSRSVRARAVKMFETIKADYGDCPNFPSGPGLRAPKNTLGEQAAVELYDCEHLQVGQTAPDISGKDIDGGKMRLSDFRGKVVFLSFWASWCGPCMQMVPHECALAKRLAGRPFAMVGVNGDSDPKAGRRARDKESMTWRSFENGGDSENGIAADWNVHGWPTVFVMDAKGVIRFKLEGYGGKRTDELLDELADELLQETGK